MLLEKKILCPASFKYLLLLSEYNIPFSQHNISFADEENLKINYPKINNQNAMQYITSNVSLFISNELEQTKLGTILTEIEGDFLYSILYPLRFERVLKPLYYRTISNAQTLQKYRTLLKQKLLQYINQDFFSNNTFKYQNIVLSSFIATLDYLGEIQWQLKEFQTIYKWYLQIKSQNKFKIILQERCPGLQPYTLFNKIDF